MQQVKKLAVIIVTYNSASVLPGLLDSLSSGLEGVEGHEVVVVDNDSHDDSVDIARGHGIVARVIQTGWNSGYAAGINAAVRTIASDTDILILNPDIRLTPNSVRKMYTAFRDPVVGMAVPQILHEDGTLSKSIRREPSMISCWSEALVGGTLASRLGLGEMVDDPELYASGGPIEWATGAILLISADARRAVGEWDESFFLYSEEVDYCQRLRAANLVVSYVPDAKVVHIGGEYEKSKFLTSLMTVNRITYFRRHHSAVASVIFRLGIIAGELIRVPKSPVHRAALRAALGGKTA
jgi:N-acetylglucosaminyl-diphospho-decaprenol L-rhamnosyltransferase